MKAAIYVSGVGSFLLLLAGLLGLLAEFPGSTNLLMAGSFVLILVYVPLMLIMKYQRDRKIDRIIEAHKGETGPELGQRTAGKTPKGWSMNDSPFRERKSGLTWGGGTISHSKAERGTRRSFLGKN